MTSLLSVACSQRKHSWNNILLVTSLDMLPCTQIDNVLSKRFKCTFEKRLTSYCSTFAFVLLAKHHSDPPFVASSTHPYLQRRFPVASLYWRLTEKISLAKIGYDPLRMHPHLCPRGMWLKPRMNYSRSIPCALAIFQDV